MAIAPGKIYVNRPVRIKANFQIDGTDTDPTDVTFQTLSPSRVEASYAYSDDEVYRSGVGNYYIDVTPDEAGRWFFRWSSTGTGTIDVQEGDFLVKDSQFYQTWPTSDYDI